jgi:NAD(P)-dependent dehydrogenase (short-subunit alcohol dehydrogenase family)
MAKEFSKRGIRVNSVAPGSTRTRIADNAFERFPEVIPGIAAKTALGRVGEPDDIGMVIATLLAEESRWITAQNIEVSDRQTSGQPMVGEGEFASERVVEPLRPCLSL